MLCVCYDLYSQKYISPTTRRAKIVLWLQSCAWKEIGGARKWSSWQKAKPVFNVIEATTPIALNFKQCLDSDSL